MMQAILHNNALQKRLDKNGWCTFPFLGTEAIAQLKAIFNTYHQSNSIQGFYASTHHPDLGLRKSIHEDILAVFKVPFQQHFTQAIPLGGSFVVKGAQLHEALEAHQDWSIVDEKKYTSYNIWVPLLNLTEKNGAIRVLSGSHKWRKNYRGPGIPDPFGLIQKALYDATEPLFLKAGEALLYDHRLIHASDPNLTSDIRLAVVFGVTEIGASLRIVTQQTPQSIDVYEADVNFFLTSSIQTGWKSLKHLETQGYSESNMSSLEFKLKKWWYR